MPPAVTVVMAAHDAEATIGEAITSILAQDLDDWELIVVDDASQDRTRAIATAFGDPRIVVLTPDGALGAARARNLAIAAAGAPLIAIADADDVSEPSRLSRQVSEFAADRSLGVLGAQLTEFGPWGERPGAARFPTDPEEIERAFARGRMGIAHPAVMLRKDLVEAVGGYDELLLRAEDLALLLRLRPTRMRALPESLVRYRTTGRVTFRYVRREVHFARLAVRGAGAGGPARTHPLDPLVTTAFAMRSWAVRRFRERRATTSARGSRGS